MIEGKSEFTQIALNKLAYSAFRKLFHSFLYSSYLRLFEKESRQMHSRRWLARLSIPMMVGAALVTSTAVAVADATDDTVLDKMHTLGFTWPAGDDSDIVAMGHQICADRMAGKSPDAIAADIHSTLGAKRHHVRRRHIHGECRRIDLLPGLVRKFRQSCNPVVSG